MIWQFGELGYDFSIDYNDRVGRKPVRWDYYDDPYRNRLYQLYSSLAKLKTENEAFGTTDFSMNVDGAMKKIHLRHASMDVVVLGNFDITEGEIDPEFTQTGTWYEYFSGTETDVVNVNDKIALKAGEYRIYTTQQFDLPNLNTAPEAQDVLISGTNEVGQVLTVTYTYFDHNDDAEGESVYQWFRMISGDAPTPISGANSLSYTITSTDADRYIFCEITPVAVGGYILEGETQTTDLIKIGGVNGIESNVQNELRVFPNPTNKFINIETNEIIESITINDMSGRTLYTGIENTTTVDVQNIESGIYLLSIHTKNSGVVTKLFVKR